MSARLHVQLITPAAVAGLRRRLADAGFELGAAPFAHFSATSEGVRVVAYKSGKLVAQGAGVPAFLERFAEALIAPDLDTNGLASVAVTTIGSDESGKGDYLGSLVVAACRLEPKDVAEVRKLGVRDSKLAGDAEIRAVTTELLKRFPIAVVEYEPEEYNRLHLETGNVNAMLGRAHGRAIKELLARGECKRIVVDRFGEESWVRNNLGVAASGLDLVVVPRAEENPAVAAASFVARARFLASLERGSVRVGVKLLPGASAAVEDCARRVVASGGRAALERVAKLHFRTTERVISGSGRPRE